jgi:rSAM/selenodomain-associated transferase 1
VRPPVALVVAKAPVPGQAKTRLGAVVGPQRAAELAAAALLDTLEACVEAFGTERCHLALAGHLADGARADDLTAATDGWTVHPQRGEGFAERLAHAHTDAAEATGAPVVQIGMDTPQVEPRHLLEAAKLLTGPHDAVLGPAYDGGWWLLGVGGPHLLAHLAEVPMSTEETGALTRMALEKAGATIRDVEVLRDIDEVADADAVAALAPATRFGREWAAR